MKWNSIYKCKSRGQKISEIFYITLTFSSVEGKEITSINLITLFYWKTETKRNKNKTSVLFKSD